VQSEQRPAARDDLAGDIVSGITRLTDDQQLGGRSKAINALMGNLKTRPGGR